MTRKHSSFIDSTHLSTQHAHTVPSMTLQNDRRVVLWPGGVLDYRGKGVNQNVQIRQCLCLSLNTRALLVVWSAQIPILIP